MLSCFSGSVSTFGVPKKKIQIMSRKDYYLASNFYFSLTGVPVSIEFPKEVQVALHWLLEQKSHVHLFDSSHHAWILSQQACLVDELI